MLGQQTPLIGRKVNLFPLVLVSWIMVIYLLATENLSWYTWVFVGIVFVERLWMQFAIWLQAILLREASKRLLDELTKATGEGNPFSRFNPPGPPEE